MALVDNSKMNILTNITYINLYHKMDLIHLKYLVRCGILDPLPPEVVYFYIKPFLKPPVNHLWELLKRNPDKPWYWLFLSQNPKSSKTTPTNHGIGMDCPRIRLLIPPFKHLTI